MVTASKLRNEHPGWEWERIEDGYGQVRYRGSKEQPSYLTVEVWPWGSQCADEWFVSQHGRKTLSFTDWAREDRYVEVTS